MTIIPIFRLFRLGVWWYNSVVQSVESRSGLRVVLIRFQRDGDEIRVGPSTIGVVKEKIGLNAKRVTARLDDFGANVAADKRRG